MSIKRHPALQPFSRDHTMALFHAFQLIWLSEGHARFDGITTVRNFRQAWEQEIHPHFINEELLLSPLAVRPESIERLINEHAELRQLVNDLLNAQDDQPDVVLCKKVGQTLDQHIRWEEHDLFAEVEQSLSESELAELQEKTKIIDINRKHGDSSA